MNNTSGTDSLNLHSMRENLPAVPNSSDTALDVLQWKMLLDYIEAIPDGVELIESNAIAKYRNSGDESPAYHKVRVNDLHDVIVKAVKSNSSDKNTINFLQTILAKYVAQYLLHVNAKQLQDINKHLTFDECDVKVEVKVSESLKNMLELVMDEICRQQQPTLLQQNEDNDFEIKISLQ